MDVQIGLDPLERDPSRKEITRSRYYDYLSFVGATPPPLKHPFRLLLNPLGARLLIELGI